MDQPGELRRATSACGSQGARLERSPFAHTREGQDGCAELQLSGDLAEDWSLRLTRGLAIRRIGVRSGYVRLLQRGGWLAELLLDVAYHESRECDFLKLATEPSAPRSIPEPRILDFELRDSASLGGSLELRVDAWDCVGLLAGVLGRAVHADLYAHEIVLDTEEECAFHQLGLKRRGGGRPGRSERRALEVALRALRQ
jgi:hypothetical protein